MNKKILSLIGFFSMGITVFSQQNPTNNNPGGAASGSSSDQFWSRAGNTDVNGSNNIFGTLWNSPVYHYASSLSRMSVGYLPAGTSLIGITGQFPNPITGNNLTRVTINRDGNYRIQRPLSLLHIGYDFDHYNSGLAQGGQRNWMDVGMMAMSGTDQIYVGLAQKSNSATGFPYTIINAPDDKQNAVVNWGDNPAGDPNGPDNLCFIYTAPPAQSGTNPFAASNDGREIMRMISNGNVGLGPVFSDGNQPKSNYHLHNSTNLSNWLQFTNENLPGVTPSSFPSVAGTVGANDGLRIGIIGNSNTNVNGTAAIYNQEIRALLFSTNANTNSVNVTNGTTLERLRIMSVGTPTYLSSGGFGTYNPGSISTNITRMAVSHDPSQPVTRPLSLLHLGYNTGLSSSPLGSTDGWRSWMDIGTFTSNGTDNMYVGLKNEGTDRFDAVVGWGDNQSAGALNEGPDNLRFIFTSTTSSVINPGDPVSRSANGLEVARMEPTVDINGLPNSYGKLGVGDFYTTSRPVTHKLHVRGNGRFEYIPDMDSAGYLIIGQKVATSNNDLEFRKLGFTGNNTQVLLGDGTWGTASGSIGGVGNYCGATPNPLTGNYEIPLNSNNFFFSGNGGNRRNFIGIGHVCSDPLEAKLDVVQTGYWRYPIGGVGGVDFAWAGKFIASTPLAHYGVGVLGAADTPGINYGVSGSANGGTQNWAGYFSGDVYISGSYGPSDKNLKRNIEDYTNANDILSRLRPTSYSFRTDEYPQLNLDDRPQIGLISQEVEEVFPSAVKETTSMPKFNSEGQMEHDAVTFKAVSYEKFIPILIGGHQEQQSEIETLKQDNELMKKENEELRNQVNQLNEKMDVLIRCLQDKIPDLCRIEQGIIQQNQGNEEQIRNSISVELSNGTAIVLNQNVPNPFAESTVITFSIPESVADAQIIFHDATGSLIKSVDVRERGNGQINVYANDLSAGAYTYSLIADGKIVATKRMVKQ